MYSIKRVYDAPSPDDGYRVLTDRLWPRGLSKERAKVNLWAKEIAPSNDLRKWFGHDPEKWAEFKRRYLLEIDANEEAVNRIRQIVSAHDKITLLYGSRDAEHNEAIILLDVLGEKPAAMPG